MGRCKSRIKRPGQRAERHRSCPALAMRRPNSSARAYISGRPGARRFAAGALRAIFGKARPRDRTARATDRRYGGERRRTAGASEARASDAASSSPKKPSIPAPLPDHLPLEKIVHDAPLVCPTCACGVAARSHVGLGMKPSRSGAEHPTNFACSLHLLRAHSGYL
jgi:hypothetical protein